QRPRARSHVRSVREADLGADLELGATNAKRPGHLSLLDANEAFDLDLVGDDHAEAEELATANHELLPEGLDDLVRALRMRPEVLDPRRRDPRLRLTLSSSPCRRARRLRSCGIDLVKR